jgi:mRNA-degrading endonuclease YafQ of YafQ-DinJ toxin-antitoxin module
VVIETLAKYDRYDNAYKRHKLLGQFQWIFWHQMR